MSDAQPQATLIGVPYHLGQPRISMGRGPVVMLDDSRAPAALRAMGIDVTVQWVDRDDPAVEDKLAIRDQMSRHLVHNRCVAELVSDARAAGRQPIVFTGNCNTSIGVTSGLDQDGVGIVWIDGHPDCETPDTSTTGLFDGMPVAVIAGLCWPAWRAQVPGFRVIPQERIVMVGVHERFADAGDRMLDHDPTPLGYAVDPPAIARDGFTAALAAGLDQLAQKTDRVYLHIDLDSLEPSEAKASLYTAPGGLSVAQLVEAIGAVAARFDVLATSFSAWDPDVDQRMPDIVEQLATVVARHTVPGASGGTATS
jgi:arginase